VSVSPLFETPVTQLSAYNTVSQQLNSMEEEPTINSKHKRKRTSSRQDDSLSAFGSVALASPTRPSTLRFKPSRISDNSWNGSDGYTAGGEEERTSSGLIEVRTSGPQASTSTGSNPVAGPSSLSQHREEAPYATASTSRSRPPRIKPSTFDDHSSSVPPLSFPFLPPLPTQAPISQDVIPSPRRTDRKSRFAPDLSFDYSIKSRLPSVSRRPSLPLPRNIPHVPPSTLPSPSRLPRIPDALPLPLPSSSKFLGPSRVSERIVRSKVAGSRGATESFSSSNGGGTFRLVRSHKVKEYPKASIPKKKRQLSRKFVSSSDDAQVPVEAEAVQSAREEVDTALENNKEEEESIVRNEKRKTVIEEIWISSDEDELKEDTMQEMDTRGVGTQEAAIGLSLLASKEEVQERVGTSPRSSIPAKRPLYRSSLTARKSVPTPERVRRKLTSTGTNSVLDENDKDEIAFEFLEYSTTSSLTHSQRKRLSQATRKSCTVGGVQQRRALIADRKSAPYLGRYSPTSSEDNSSPPPCSASSSLPVVSRQGAHKVSRKDLLSVAARKTVPAFRASSPQSPRARSSSLSDAHSSPPAPSVREEIAPGVNVVSPQPQLEETSHLPHSTRPPDDSIPAIPPLSDPPSTTLPFSRDPFPASTRIESTENQSPAPTSFKPTASASFYSRSTSRPPTPSLLLRTSIPTTTSIVVDSTAATTVNSQAERAVTRPSPSLPSNEIIDAATPVDINEQSVPQSTDRDEGGGREPEEARIITDEPLQTLQKLPGWSYGTRAHQVRTLESEAQKFLPKTFERVGASERMLRKRSSNGSVVIEKPREESSTPSETSSLKKGKNDEKETKGKGQGKSWVELLRIDDGPKGQIPRDFQ